MIPTVFRAAARSSQLLRALSVASATGGRAAGESESHSYNTGGAAAGLPAALLGVAASCTLGLATAFAEISKDAPAPFEPLTNNPMEYDAVTNEHTARMTMARAAALEHYQAGRYPQAEVKLIEALESCKLGFDSKDPHIASCMNNLAEFYRNTGQYDKAEVLYLEALDLLESIFGERHWLYVSAMHNLALMHEARGELEDARDTMTRVMRLRLQMFGPRHFLYADSMFALAHIYAKLAARSQEEAAAAVRKVPEGKAARVEGGGWFGWLRSKRGGVKSAAGKEESAQVVKLMRDAIVIMEDAENVQVNVVLYWLVELAGEYERRGELKPAIECMRKALHHFGSDKGEAMAQASQLSDRLVDLLIKAGLKDDARTAMQACVSGRTAAFGRELVVAQSMLRLATIEASIKKPEADASALQNAANAAALAQELMKDYSKPSVTNWMGPKGQDTSLKRVQAGNICGAAYKFLAALQKRMGAMPEMEKALVQAVDVFQGTADASSTQMKLLKPGGRPGASAVPDALIDEVSSLYIEVHLALLDCLEQLSELVGGRGEIVRAAALTQQAEAIAQEMLKISGRG